MNTTLAHPLTPVTTAGVRPLEDTIRSTWLAVAGSPATDRLLEWAPDLFAFTDVILDRTEAYRFVVSPPAHRTWPPSGGAAWRDLVSAAARSWATRLAGGSQPPAELLQAEWRVLASELDTPLDEVASGQAWRACQALLTLHAIADEACAGVAAGTSRPDEHWIVSGARMLELLARTGSIARIDPARLRVLPKYRTAPGGITSRSISRYAAVAPSRVTYSVRRVATPRSGSASDDINVLLLPWPLRLSAGDFQPVADSIEERDAEPFGFFRYLPAEPFDLSLVDRLLVSAREHVDRVDVVVTPESSVPREAIAGLEALLSRHGVTMLVAGVRDGAGAGAARDLMSNWVHFGALVDGRWWHSRQNKHHRWSLNRSQIEQYHLGAVLDPRVRWWEAIEIQRRSLQVIERDDGHTVASLVCEDLAQLDDVVHLLRAVGPTLVVALLLDGPQLASRWTARYASMLADDPGSAVLTLTAHGLAASARRAGQDPATPVALWKDSARHVQEISLEPGAQGILLRLHGSRTIRRAADGRSPEHNAADLRLADVVQLHAAPTSSRVTAPGPPPEPLLSAADVTVLLSWTEALARARRAQPTAVGAVLANARTGSAWRADLNLPQPTGALSNALNTLGGGEDVGDSV